MRRPWNLPSYPVYSLLTRGGDDTVNHVFPQKREVLGSKNNSKGAYRDISDREISFSEEEIRSFSGNMNIMTYVIPVSMKPKHYIIAIYDDTRSLENWQSTHRGILQILAPSHAPLVRVLGKKSGKVYDKMAYLTKKGLLTSSGMLRDIAGYLELEEISELPNRDGDHRLYLCRVISFDSYHSDILTTHILESEKIIL